MGGPWLTIFCFSPLFGQNIGLNFSEDLFFCSSPNFGQKNQKKNLRKVGAQRDLGARYRPSYPLKKFLSEALPSGICCNIFFVRRRVARSLQLGGGCSGCHGQRRTKKRSTSG